MRKMSNGEKLTLAFLESKANPTLQISYKELSRNLEMSVSGMTEIIRKLVTRGKLILIAWPHGETTGFPPNTYIVVSKCVDVASVLKETIGDTKDAEVKGIQSETIS